MKKYDLNTNLPNININVSNSNNESNNKTPPTLNESENITENSISLLNSNNTTPKTNFKESITKLKVLQNNMENNYINLLKSISKTVLKPKDLLRRPDPAVLAKNIK